MATIDEDTQAGFVALSGDRNPLHADALTARRSQFGGPVVHGVHLVLRALQSAVKEHASLQHLHAQFRGAVLVGETVDCVAERLSSRRHRVAVCVDDLLRANVTFELDPSRWSDSGGGRIEWPRDIAHQTLKSISDVSGHEELGFDRELFQRLFPDLAERLSPDDVAVLLATTRVIGMRCPGEWALFRQLKWDASSERRARSAHLTFTVSGVDRRFDLINVELTDGATNLTAEVQLRRPPPVQPSLNTVRAAVTVAEFATMRALVVGGSRGLGELAAKLVVAGGGRVLLTYRAGKAEADALVRELGAGTSALHLAVEDLDALPPQIDGFSPTHVLYFPTPPISKRRGGWDVPTFENFVEVYVHGLTRLLDLLGSHAVQGLFVPSTIYVDLAPSGFSEYVPAKVAAEAVAREWEGRRSGRRAVVPRLSPLITDQTAAVLAGSTDANIAHLIEPLRVFAESTK